MRSDHSKTPLWHRAGNIVGLTVIMAAIALPWISPYQTAVAAYDFLHEAATNTSDSVSLSDLATFALMLIGANALYIVFDPDLKRRAESIARRAREFLNPAPISQEADTARADRILVQHVRNRPSGI